MKIYMNLKNNQTIAGIVLFTLWIILMVLFGKSMGIKIDQSNPIDYPLYQN